MNDSKLTLLVTEAVRLDRQISKLEEDLKEKKKLIAAEAKSRKSEATKTEGGGHSITFEGIDGCICRVTTAGKTLASTISKSEEVEELKKNAKGFFSRLFTPSVIYKPVEKFREIAKELLGDESAKLVKLCENAGKTTVSFETKETA